MNAPIYYTTENFVKSSAKVHFPFFVAGQLMSIEFSKIYQGIQQGQGSMESSFEVAKLHLTLSGLDCKK